MEILNNSNIKNLPKKEELKKDTTSSFFIPRRDSVRLEAPIKHRFNVLLRRIGRSQNWLADEIGLSRGTMSKIANGGWFPQSDIMIRICEILEIQSVALFGDCKYWKQWNDKMIYKKEGEKK